VKKILLLSTPNISAKKTTIQHWKTVINSFSAMSKSISSITRHKSWIITLILTLIQSQIVFHLAAYCMKLFMESTPLKANSPISTLFMKCKKVSLVNSLEKFSNHIRKEQKLKSC